MGGYFCHLFCSVLLGFSALAADDLHVPGRYGWAALCGGVIPALFKAKFDTNETLFTLMLNYVALYLILFCVTARGKTQILPDFRKLPDLEKMRSWIKFSAYMQAG